MANSAAGSVVVGGAVCAPASESADGHLSGWVTWLKQCLRPLCCMRLASRAGTLANATALGLSRGGGRIDSGTAEVGRWWETGNKGSIKSRAVDLKQNVCHKQRQSLPQIKSILERCCGWAFPP